MGIQVTATGMYTHPRQEPLPQDTGFARQQSQLRSRTAELNAAALERFASSLPGNQGYEEPEHKRLVSTAADLERISLAFNKKLKFVIDQQSHEVIVKVIDSSTDKVIKVLPPEELQRLHRKIRETIGFLFDERV